MVVQMFAGAAAVPLIYAAYVVQQNRMRAAQRKAYNDRVTLAMTKAQNGISRDNKVIVSIKILGFEEDESDPKDKHTRYVIETAWKTVHGETRRAVSRRRYNEFVALHKAASGLFAMRDISFPCGAVWRPSKTTKMDRSNAFVSYLYVVAVDAADEPARCVYDALVAFLGI